MNPRTRKQEPMRRSLVNTVRAVDRDLGPIVFGAALVLLLILAGNLVALFAGGEPAIF